MLPFAPMPLLDDFIINYTFGQAILLRFILSLPVFADEPMDDRVSDTGEDDREDGVADEQPKGDVRARQ